MRVFFFPKLLLVLPSAPLPTEVRLGFFKSRAPSAWFILKGTQPVSFLPWLFWRDVRFLSQVQRAGSACSSRSRQRVQPLLWQHLPAPFALVPAHSLRRPPLPLDGHFFFAVALCMGFLPVRPGSFCVFTLPGRQMDNNHPVTRTSLPIFYFNFSRANEFLYREFSRHFYFLKGTGVTARDPFPFPRPGECGLPSPLSGSTGERGSPVSGQGSSGRCHWELATVHRNQYVQFTKFGSTCERVDSFDLLFVV